MNLAESSEFLGVIVVAGFFLLMVIFAILGRSRPLMGLRTIPAFARLSRAIGLAVEAGTRLHVSVGQGNLTSPGSAASFVGLAMLGRIARTASISDSPPVASAGDGALAILAQDTLRAGYREVGAIEAFDPDYGRVTGLTPISFAAGAMVLMAEENVSGNLLAGSFGTEAGLILEASDRNEAFSLSGTDHIPTQAMMFAASQETLIGEELYAGGAYLRAGIGHTASLQAQDVVRWLLILMIMGGGLMKFVLGFLSP
ncbi:MAG: hypothetical protein H6636_07985 [Anaerolineales bacterium]|nr:hypothetical protein [Anaerolineales bacterium]